MVIALGAFAFLPMLYRGISVIYAQIRLLVSLNTENQRYFASPGGELIPWLKKNVFYAPLLRVRHNREFQLSTAVNVGTLPTRFQTFFLVGYVATNIIFCTYKLDYSDTQTMLSELKNRTGVMSTVNMVPLFLLAGRNNPLIGLLGISFDSFNLVHRWLGRIVVLEALAHTFAWMVGKAMTVGWEVVRVSITTSAFIMPGFVVYEFSISLFGRCRGLYIADRVLGDRCIYFPPPALTFGHPPCVLRNVPCLPHSSRSRGLCRSLLPSRIQGVSPGLAQLPQGRHDLVGH